MIKGRFYYCILSLLLFLFSSQSYAGIVLKGVVADNGGVTLPGALLVLQDAGGAVVSSAETDADGAFSIEAEKAGEYHLSASAFLFNTVTRTVSVTGEAEQNVGTIVLEPQETLDAAKVSSERKYVQTKVNGFAYDVASDPDAEKLTARELLLRIPFVKVDPQTQAVQVLGKDVEFTVNGKKSTLLSGENQAYMTKLLTGGKLKSIQLVTQTSGRHADKSAVINLDTQDALGDLIAGQLRVDAGDDAHAGGYAGLTSKNGGLVYDVSYKYTWSDLYGSETRQNVDYLKSEEYSKSEIFDRTDPTRDNRHVANLRSSYDFTPESRLFVEASADVDDAHNALRAGSTYWDKSGAVVSESSSEGSSKMNIGRYKASAGWQRSSAEHPSRLFTLQYAFDGSDMSSSYDQTVTGPTGSGRTTYGNSTSMREHTVSADYGDMLRGGSTWYLTGKYVNRSYESRNYLNYTQQVGSVKGSWSKMGEKWMVDAKLSGELVSDYSTSFDLLYGLRFVYRPALRHSLTLNVAKEAFRPDINYLNPYKDESVPGIIVQGNPNLKNERYYNAMLMYQFFSGKSVNLSALVSERYTNNGVFAYDKVLEDGVLYHTYDNIGKASYLFFSGTVDVTPWPWLNMSLAFSLRNQSYSYFDQTNCFWTRFMYFQTEIALWKGAKLDCHAFYTDPSLFLGDMGIQTNSAKNVLAECSMGLTQNIGDNLSVQIGTIQPWSKYTVYQSSSISDEMLNNKTYQRAGRSFFFRLRYSFGRFKGYVPFNSRSIDNADRRK